MAVATGQSNWDVKQAMLASLELLEDVEQQVKQSIGLGGNVSISDISEEQLQLVPAELLSALDATMTVVQQLRQQLPLSTSPPTAGAAADNDDCASGNSNEADNASAAGYAEVASKATRSNSPSSITSRKNKQYIPVRPASAPTARPYWGATSSSPGSSPSQRSLQSNSSKAAFSSGRASPNPLRSPAKANSFARHVEAARSSLFSSTASQEATEQWLAGKVQQQQDAATAYQRDLQKERQQLAKLQEKRLAAAQAHAQAMQDIQGLVQLNSMLQALVTAEDQWEGYLATIKDGLQT